MIIHDEGVVLDTDYISMAFLQGNAERPTLHIYLQNGNGPVLLHDQTALNMMDAIRKAMVYECAEDDEMDSRPAQNFLGTQYGKSKYDKELDLTAMVSRGCMTINEVRRFVKLPPPDDAAGPVTSPV